tara:strand:+ start:15975 stop:17177 length:1203 start_codon:yes stop_codon:yes gene_type:complete
MTRLFALTGRIQNYAWGGFEFISELLGKEKSNEPSAEYWLGAHVNAPSTILTSDGERALNDYIDSNTIEKLGKKIAVNFGRLPFLFKVLDVCKMLSIQVHPSKIEAEKGFRFENEQGIPLTAANRNYKDDNHKPEIMVALSEFWLLHGFLPKIELMEMLKKTPEFSCLVSVFREEGYLGLYKNVMEQSVAQSNAMLSPLVDRILPLYLDGKLEKSNPDYWAAKAVDCAVDKSVFDKGIYSIYFFNVLKVDKGEAVFQDAGVPHAYLEGQNMELMANSDNVLRGGLTPKHVDVPELLKHVVFDETHPTILKGELQSDGLERIYTTPAPDFQLSQIHLSNDAMYKADARTAEIIIVIEGEIDIVEGDSELKFHKGTCAFLESGSNYRISSASSAVIYKATAP